MSEARVALHGLALMVPLVMVCGAGMFLSVPAEWFLSVGCAAIVSAQTAVAMTWPLLEWQARRGSSAWWVGAPMAFITHVGVAVGILAITVLRDPKNWREISFELLGMMIVITFVVVGCLSVPITMLLTHFIGRMRRKEILHALG